MSQTNTDPVTLTVGQQQISGWTALSVRMSVDLTPNTFTLEATEFYPSPGPVPALTSTVIVEGQPCTISIGSDLVLTGYVVTVERFMSADEHGVRVTGASKSTDLVECSAEFSTFQMNNTSPLALISKLCKPFGISVIPGQGYTDTVPIQQISVILTETAYEIAERVCRYAAVLFYDRTDGNMTLSAVGTTHAASGFAEGNNIERIAYGRSMGGRYSKVRAIIMPTTTLFTTPDESDLQGQLSSITTGAPVTDAQVGRYRPLLILAEQGDANYRVAQQRAQWEVNRRYGRSQVVELTCDSWRDSAGKLWTPNTLATVSSPSLGLQPQDPLLIGEVTFRLDADGTHADVVLMPPQAFTPEPIVINPMANAVGQAVNSSGNTPLPTPQQTAPGAS